MHALTAVKYQKPVNTLTSLEMSKVKLSRPSCSKSMWRYPTDTMYIAIQRICVSKTYCAIHPPFEQTGPGVWLSGL